MILIALPQETQKSLFEVIAARFQEGGSFIMMIILLVGVLGIILLIRGIFFAQKKDPRLKQSIILINSLGIFALVLGVFGQLIKLIYTLDYLSSFEGTTPRDFADGLKVTLLPTLFGVFIFLFTRISTITLNFLKPHLQEGS